MKYDNLLKTIFYDAMPGMIRALGWPPVVEYLSVEFPAQPKMVADVVARLSDGRILHLEFQVANDPRMHWRCYHYFGAIQEQWEDAEVIQVVIYLGNGPMSMTSAIRKPPSLDYRFQIVDIHRIPAEAFLTSPNDAERVLAVLCESADPRETIHRVLASWRHLSDQVLLENVDRLRTLSQLRGFEIIALEELKQMPFDLDITESITFKMGQALGEARLFTRHLERRFGPLPESLSARIATASTEQIEIWDDREPNAHGLNDIFGPGL